VHGWTLETCHGRNRESMVSPFTRRDPRTDACFGRDGETSFRSVPDTRLTVIRGAPGAAERARKKKLSRHILVGDRASTPARGQVALSTLGRRVEWTLVLGFGQEVTTRRA